MLIGNLSVIDLMIISYSVTITSRCVDWHCSKQLYCLNTTTIAHWTNKLYYNVAILPSYPVFVTSNFPPEIELVMEKRFVPEVVANLLLICAKKSEYILY